MRNNKIFLVLPVIAALLGSWQLPAQAEDGMRGTLSLSGAWAIYPLAVKWGEAFHNLHPDVQMNISAGGAGKGMADALSDAVDIGMVSREVDQAEKSRGAEPIFIAKDAVFCTVNAANPAISAIRRKGLSIDMLGGIYIRGKIRTWKQAVGGPEAPIHAYTRSDACGAASAWASVLGKHKQEELKGIGVYGDPGVLDAVRKDRLGIGYNNLSYVFEGNRPVRGISIAPIDANRNGKIDPSELIDTRAKAYKAVANGTYPGARREFFVTKGKPKGLAAEFIKFALSEEGTKILEKVGGYVPLSNGERKAQLLKMK